MPTSASAFRDPKHYPFTAGLEASFEAILGELRALRPDDFEESPDALTSVANGYDERGWRYFALIRDGRRVEPNAARCPRTVTACSAVPEMVEAGFSLFQSGTHLYPHRGERIDVLRCHFPLIVPTGDSAIRAGSEVRSWQRGRSFIFDDTFEHEAWNRGDSDRIVLLVTFARPSERVIDTLSEPD
jgi:beta-hydroxylase